MSEFLSFLRLNNITLCVCIYIYNYNIYSVYMYNTVHIVYTFMYVACKIYHILCICSFLNGYLVASIF